MNNEKQNEMPAWREELLQWEKNGGKAEQPQNLLWEKLQTRLQPRKDKRIVYLFRAAIVIALIMLGFFFLYKKTPSSKIVVNKKNNHSLSTPENEVVDIKTEKADPVIKTFSPVKKVTTVVQHIEQPIEIPVDPDAEIVSKDSTPVPVITLAQTTLPVRKIKVVHMNELNAPPPPAYVSLKDQWGVQQKEVDEVNINPGPSIWPGRNKTKHTFTASN